MVNGPRKAGAERSDGDFSSLTTICSLVPPGDARARLGNSRGAAGSTRMAGTGSYESGESPTMAGPG
jgi:hypothetical protein